MVVIRLNRAVVLGILTALMLVMLGGVGFFVGRWWMGSSSPTAGVPAPQGPSAGVAPAPQGPGPALAPAPQNPAAAVPKAGQNVAPATGSEAAEAALPRVTIDEARQKLGQANILFVDTRSTGEYQQSRIKGSASLPFAEASKRFNEMPRDKDLILYCA